jgi:hypothetical protein
VDPVEKNGESAKEARSIGKTEARSRRNGITGLFEIGNKAWPATGVGRLVVMGAAELVRSYLSKAWSLLP